MWVLVGTYLAKGGSACRVPQGTDFFSHQQHKQFSLQQDLLVQFFLSPSAYSRNPNCFGALASISAFLCAIRLLGPGSALPPPALPSQGP